MTALITLTYAVDAGPFNLFSDANGYCCAFASNVSQADLLIGLPVTMPDGTTIVRVRSVGVCTNFVDLPVPSSEPIFPDADFLVYRTVPDVSNTASINFDGQVTDPPVSQTFDLVNVCTTTPITSGMNAGPYLYWGGNNLTLPGTESMLVDVKQILLDSIDPPFIYAVFRGFLNINAPVTGLVHIELKAYKDGVMLSDGNYGFINSGGTQIGPTYNFGPTEVSITGLDTPCMSNIMSCMGAFSYDVLTGLVTHIPC